MEPLLMIWKNGATHTVTTETQKATFEKAGWKPYAEPEPVDEEVEPETDYLEEPEPEPEKPKEEKKNARKNSQLSE